jgi:hypothetical protein
MDYNHRDLIAQRLSAGSYLCLRMVLGGLNDGFACKVLKEMIVLFEKKDTTDVLAQVYVPD